MHVTIIENDRLPEMAESLFPETVIAAQYERGSVTAVLWSLDGPELLQRAHLVTVLKMPTVPFREALTFMADFFGLNIPCVQ